MDILINTVNQWMRLSLKAIYTSSLKEELLFVER